MGQSQSVEGQLRLTASELTSAFVLPPIVKKISSKAPRLELDVIADNGVSDLTRREADIAIRHTQPNQPNLYAKRPRDERMNFYASADYLASNGHPTKGAISSHQIVSYVDADRMLGYLVPAGLELTRANFRFTSSSQLVALQLVRNGLGLAVLPESAAVTIPDLVHVDIDVGPFDLPIWLVTNSELKTSRRVRFVFDSITDHLS